MVLDRTPHGENGRFIYVHARGVITLMVKATDEEL
jgi:hypothetical protein